MKLRVLVCGSREWTDELPVRAVLDGLYESAWDEFYVCQGGARGADAIAKKWCEDEEVPVNTFPADWSKGKQAGYLRNAQMLEEGKPTVVFAFGHGKGTDMMVNLAVKAGVPTYRVVRESTIQSAE
jgi:hypothetical protein